MIEIGGDEVGIVFRQEAIGAVVETLAGHVHVVGVEHPVDEARRHPSGREAGAALDDGAQQSGGAIRRVDELRIIGLHDVIDQDADQISSVERGVALKRAEPDVAVRQAGHDRAAGGARFVAALQVFAGLDQRKRA